MLTLKKYQSMKQAFEQGINSGQAVVHIEAEWLRELFVMLDEMAAHNAILRIENETLRQISQDK